MLILDYKLNLNLILMSNPNTMKNYFFLLTFLWASSLLFSQEKFNAYNPNADAKKDIENAVSKAKSENKHVLIQIGGNWCGWCKLFHDLTKSNEELKSYIAQNYEVVLLNYSKENQNLAVLEQLEFPQRFGFPVFVILDGNGKRIHTQSSGYLEEGNGHDPKKVM